MNTVVAYRVNALKGMSTILADVNALNDMNTVFTKDVQGIGRIGVQNTSAQDNYTHLQCLGSKVALAYHRCLLYSLLLQISRDRWTPKSNKALTGKSRML